MNEVQRAALVRICERFSVPYDEAHYRPVFDLPSDWVAGWVGGPDHEKLYIGCDPEGRISS